MRIVHVITGLAGGGAERALFNLLAVQHDQFLDHAVISLRDEGVYAERLRALGIPVYVIGIKGLWPTLFDLLRLLSLMRKLKPIIIQGWMYHGNLAATIANAFCWHQSIVLWNVRHSLYSLSAEKYLSRWVIRINRIFSSFPKQIIYNSLVSSRLHESFGFDNKKSRIIPNGFDLNSLQKNLNIRINLRSKNLYSTNEVVIGHVARFDSLKNHAGFLRVAARLADKYHHLRFLLVGKNVNLNNEVLQGIIPESLLSKFLFTGERMDVYDLMQAMDIFCLNSISEAFPNVIGEAMALEVPCVVTDVGDSAHIVGNTGIVVPPANDDSLFYGLQEMILKSEAERRELGRLARERIAENFSLDKIVEQYVQTYKGLVK